MVNSNLFYHMNLEFFLVTKKIVNDFSSFEDHPEFNLITLPRIDDHDYPPQKKSFTALKYVLENHSESAEWFIRIDDDAVLQWENLEKFLNGLDYNKPLFIGAPG